MPQEPFRIFGNAYYVGPHGLSAILVTSPGGHVLLDAALPESAPQIAAHIRQLGFRLEDIRLIVNSHVHFDHAGGIAELQRMTGARVAASPWSAGVLRTGHVSRSDPQYGLIPDTPRVSRVVTLHDGEVFHAGDIALTAHLTGGHTPGGTSWTWQSCEMENNQATRCLKMVYADSLTAVSADGFRFSDSAAYPTGVQDFEKSFAFLRSTPCDILLTTHPDASGFWDRVAKQRMLTPNGCVELAERSSSQLRQRLADEHGH
jgi:metallo-beta-lactamase class B